MLRVAHKAGIDSAMSVQVLHIFYSYLAFSAATCKLFHLFYHLITPLTPLMCSLAVFSAVRVYAVSDRNTVLAVLVILLNLPPMAINAVRSSVKPIWDATTLLACQSVHP